MPKGSDSKGPELGTGNLYFKPTSPGDFDTGGLQNMLL